MIGKNIKLIMNKENIITIIAIGLTFATSCLSFYLSYENNNIQKQNNKAIQELENKVYKKSEHEDYYKKVIDILKEPELFIFKSGYIELIQIKKILESEEYKLKKETHQNKIKNWYSKYNSNGDFEYFIKPCEFSKIYEIIGNKEDAINYSEIGNCQKNEVDKYANLSRLSHSISISTDIEFKKDMYQEKSIQYANKLFESYLEIEDNQNYSYITIPVNYLPKEINNEVIENKKIYKLEDIIKYSENLEILLKESPELKMVLEKIIEEKNKENEFR